MNVNPDMAKREKARLNIEKWTEEYNKADASIKADEAGIMLKHGVRCEDVFTKVSEPTGKFNENGKEQKQTKYILTDNVRYDSDSNEYVVTIADEGDMEGTPIKDENDNEGAPVEAVTAEQPAEELPKELNDLTAQAVESEPAEAMQEEPAFEEMFGH